MKLLLEALDAARNTETKGTTYTNRWFLLAKSGSQVLGSNQPQVPQADGGSQTGAWRKTLQARWFELPPWVLP
jgi:hypothetical protein